MPKYYKKWGTLSPHVREVPFLFWMHERKAAHLICSPLRVIDVAPIVAWHLNVSSNDVWTGRTPPEFFHLDEPLQCPTDVSSVAVAGDPMKKQTFLSAESSNGSLSAKDCPWTSMLVGLLLVEILLSC